MRAGAAATESFQSKWHVGTLYAQHVFWWSKLKIRELRTFLVSAPSAKLPLTSKKTSLKCRWQCWILISLKTSKFKRKSSLDFNVTLIKERSHTTSTNCTSLCVLPALKIEKTSKRKTLKRRRKMTFWRFQSTTSTSSWTCSVWSHNCLNNTKSWKLKTLISKDQSSRKYSTSLPKSSQAIFQIKSKSKSSTSTAQKSKRSQQIQRLILHW